VNGAPATDAYGRPITPNAAPKTDAYGRPITAPTTDAYGRPITPNNGSTMPNGQTSFGAGSTGNDPYGRNGQSSRGSLETTSNSLRDSFKVDNERVRQQEAELMRQRDITEAWRLREEEEELRRLQEDIESKRKQIERLTAGENRSSGSSMRMAGEDVPAAQRRSEQAKRWAAEEASRKGFSGYDGIPSYQYRDGGRMRDPRAESDRIWNIYKKWCSYFGKQPDDYRFDTFSDNLYLAEKHALTRVESVQLSEFADLTAAEYRQRRSGRKGGRSLWDSEEPRYRRARSRDEEYSGWDDEEPRYR